MNKLDADVIIIGAGPSGAVAAAILCRAGRNVLVLEKESFPRFSIGESLLPQSMVYFEEAGMLDIVNEAGFQFKNGAAFRFGEQYAAFDFREKFTAGPGTTFQVQRADFDQLLADRAQQQGADIRYRHEIIGVDFNDQRASVACLDEAGVAQTYTAQFVLDASGFGRVLPRLLELNSPSDFPVRQSLFTHIEDNISCSSYDREKILVTIHPRHRDVWIWLIPFANGRCSVGAVATPELLASYPGEPEQQLRQLIAEDAHLSQLLQRARFDTEVRKIVGYSANVKSLHGQRFALLGNAGEFLDPVFSSGVTVAVKSASIAANLLLRQLAGESVDWQTEFAEPLGQGVDVFRTFVTRWYTHELQDVIFYAEQNDEIKGMISSVLAGYVWDPENPYVAKSERRLKVLAEICRQ
ncbi:flavin-dependent dehydrogenase [Sinobacterium caligoides]|uniref:Flavin-dependent dehydrogenase n=1 Tax=Sinobacterium caligoides TaxID=933926 RepID=A0A3N2DGL0_9GAMM|nr:NAD(P)/FAD-dependent oxidoreductase [Sinobacterium caligoides]ROR98871.1 flavin-dependent dehydrogenase [Sinobacterium caligoides]